MPGSVFVRRQLGNRLAEARRAAKVTQAEVGRLKLMSESKLLRIEKGQQACTVGDVLALLRLYRTPPDLADTLVALAEVAATDGVWEDNPDVLPNWFGLYAGAEAGCSALSAYHPELVLGVLQDTQYARAVIDIDGVLNEEVIESRLKLRGERQRAIIDREDRRISVVLGPGTFELTIGSDQVMARQRAHLMALNELPGMDIRILPRRTGIHPGVSGPFTILDFEDPSDPTVVYLEYLTGARYLESRQHVQAYRTAFASLKRLSVPIEEFA